ncbi:MAG: hypothetical protein ACPGLV_17435, partial [Bacteroidia bacterium]
MKHFYFALLLLLSSTTLSAQYQFITNGGQWNKNILYKAYIDAGEIFLEKDGIKFFFYDGEKVAQFHKNKAKDSMLNCHALKIEFVGSNVPESVDVAYESETSFNYFLGNNRSKWAGGLKAYEKIVLKEIYEGIDFEIYSYQYKIKYNFYVKPGADASQIKLKYHGADDVILKNGILNIHTSLRTLFEESPYVYEATRNNELPKEIESAFELNGNEVTFDIKDTYRKDRTLVIDPTVVFATFSGSTADNFGFTATYDDDGHAYSGGCVYDFGFPVTTGAFQM